MHDAARAFVARTLAGLPPRRSVVEVGSRFVNGQVRDLLNGVAYTGLDLYPGDGVDVVGDAADWQPPAPVDTVICCEVLEHCERPAELCARAYDWLEPAGGVFILTAAGPERAPHSGIDGAGLRAGESYRGVTEADLTAWLAPFVGHFGIVRDPGRGDIYAVAERPAPAGKLKILVVRSASDFSTKDVEENLIAGLRALGHDVGDYDLRTRLSRSASWLLSNYRRAVRSHPELAEPDLSDFCYQAGLGVIEMALRHVPDWIIVVTGVLLHPEIPLLLKRAGAPLAFLLTESPYNDDEQPDIIRHADIAWTNERISVPVLRRYLPNVHYLPHAYNPAHHRPDADDGDTPAHDVVFVGTAFDERVEVLSAVDWTGIDLALYGDWRRLPSRHRLRRYVRDGITDNARAAALYRRAKVGLNLYRTSWGLTKGAPRIAHAESLNPRAYELAACGAFHLSDHRAEVCEVFGGLVPVFNGPTELQAAVRFWLDHEEERRKVAAMLPRAVAGHTWTDRAQTIVDGLRATTPRLPEKQVAALAAS